MRGVKAYFEIVGFANISWDFWDLAIIILGFGPPLPPLFTQKSQN